MCQDLVNQQGMCMPRLGKSTRDVCAQIWYNQQGMCVPRFGTINKEGVCPDLVCKTSSLYLHNNNKNFYNTHYTVGSPFGCRHRNIVTKLVS